MKKISDEILMDALSVYINNHPNEKVNFSTLEKESGIKRGNFYNHQKVKAMIDDYNNMSLVIADYEANRFIIPSAHTIMTNAYSNKERMTKELTMLIRILNHLIGKVSKLDVNPELTARLCELENKNVSLKSENEKLKRKINDFHNEFNLVLAKSTTAKGRKEFGLLESLITIESSNQKQTSFSAKKLAQEYSNLFND